MRTSDYNIYVKLPHGRGYLIVHGYTGAVDMVDESVVSFLKDRTEPRQNSTPLNSRPPEETIETLHARGYITAWAPHEEREFVFRLARRLHDAS